MTAPDWLVSRNGALAQGLTEHTVLVTLDGHPQYRLIATPAMGTFTCAVTQTNNGRRLDDGKKYSSNSDAISGGLEELRAKLGW